MNAKTTSIIAYLGLVGFLIAFLAGDKTSSLSKRHLNQGLICALCAFIPFIGWVAYLVFAIMGIMRAINEDETPLPVIGGIELIK